MARMNKTITAIMGGTFDPVHLGHMSFARDVLEQTEVQQVVFMPAKLQPFKLDVKMSSFEDRAAMLELACDSMNEELAGSQKNVSVSTLENDLSGVSYTYRTLDEFRKRYPGKSPGSELFFITGTDTFTALGTWKCHEHLLKENSFIVGVRPGYPDDDIYRKKEEYESKYGTKVLVISNTPVDLSATEIRNDIAAGRSVSGKVTEQVMSYIAEHSLYR